MRRILPLLVAAALLCWPPAGQASTEWGRLKWIAVRAADGLVYFAIEVPTFPAGYPPRTPRPACATQGYWILGNVANPAVRLQYDLLLRSKENSVQLRIDGSGTCTGWPDAEDVETVQYGT